MKVSAVLIVKNEEEILKGCLESVKDADEIIVVDTGSTDKTVEIAKEYTDKVHFFEWCDDFAAARNEAIKHATGDWIFSIDADHLLLTPMEEVRAECEKADAEGHTGCFIKALWDEKGEKFHWGTSLFKNIPENRWKGRVHEHLPSPTYYSSVTKLIGYSKNHSKDPDRNLRILEKSEKTARTKFYLGREHYERRQYHEAIEWLLSYIPEGTWLPEIAEAHLTLARCYWFTSQGDKARAACFEAIKLNPDFKEALLLMSVMHFSPWKEKWARLSEAATNQDVLFIRN